MTAIARLVTFVDLVDENASARRVSFSARHDAVLRDGRRVLLLDDRGWSQFLHAYGDSAEAASDALTGVSHWNYLTREAIEESARSVVGPDEPYDGLTAAETEEADWAFLANRLSREDGVEIAPADLSAARHDVELSDRLVARLRRT